MAKIPFGSLKSLVVIGYQNSFLKIKRGSHRQKILLLPQHLSDKFMQTVSKFIPEHLPQNLWDYRNKYEHHNYQNGWKKAFKEAREYLESYIADGSKR